MGFTPSLLRAWVNSGVLIDDGNRVQTETGTWSCSSSIRSD
jgi:hypothetical protein